MKTWKVFIQMRDKEGRHYIIDYTAYPDREKPEEAVDTVLKWCVGYNIDEMRIIKAWAVEDKYVSEFQIEPIVRDQWKRAEVPKFGA